MPLDSPRKAFRHRPGVPSDWRPDAEEHRRMIAEAVSDLRRGKMNNTGKITFAANQTTTTVLSPLVEAESCIFLTPLTSSAAAENWYLSGVVPGESFTLTHANAPSTDRNFCYAVFS